MDYIKEYYVNNKFYGFLPSGKDREVIGYNGRIKEISNSNIKIGKRTIKAGEEFMTILYPLVKGRLCQ